MRLAQLLVKVLCLLALIGSSLPAMASEAVCVMPNRAVVPMATCGMPCCARKTQPDAVCLPSAAKPSCCQGPKSKSWVTKARIHVASASCRCEFRSKATFASATFSPTVPAQAAANVPVVLTEPISFTIAEAVFTAQPGIVGCDSGPPPDPLSSGLFGRAPPARSVSS